MTAPARPAGPARAGADLQVIGGLLVLGGCGWLLRQSGLVEIQLQTGLSGLLLALGIGMVVTARRAGGAPLVVIGVVLIAALAVTSSVDLGAAQREVGDRTFRPTTIADVSRFYEVAFGELEVDLTRVDDLRGEHRSSIQVTAGSIEVVVPEGMAVEVVAKVGAGDIALFDGPVAEGAGEQRRHTDPGFAEATDRLVLDLNVGLGEVSVVRARR